MSKQRDAELGSVDENIRQQFAPQRFGEPCDDDQSSAPHGNAKEASVTGFAKYLAEIKRFPELEPQEEYELAKAWRKHGDCLARDRLILSHLHLVVSIAEDHRGYRLSKEDLVSEGTVGLIRAVDRFDPDREHAGKPIRLSTFARSRIRGHMRNLAKYFASLVKMGTTDNQSKLFFKLKEQKERLGILHDGDMKPEQVNRIAEQLGVKEEEVIEMNCRRVGDVSLDALMLAGQDFDDGVASQESQHIEAEELESARKALNQNLNDRELRIVTARHPNDDDKLITLKTLADELGITCSAVYQIHKRALEKMKVSHLLAPKHRDNDMKPEQTEKQEIYATREEQVVEVERTPGRVCTPAERAETEERLRASGTNAFRNATKSEREKIKARHADKAEQAVSEDILCQDIELFEPIELPKPSFVVGAEVCVLSGPFATRKGIVEEVDKARSRVKVAMSGCITSVEMKFEQIEQTSESIKQRDAWKPGNSGVAYPSRQKNEDLNE